jgi:pullulanase
VLTLENLGGAGFVIDPSEVVNYVENHDNATLFDNGVFKLPTSTSKDDRARVQNLSAAIVAFSQGVAYFHAGGEVLRSKSLDRNSYDSGDWFNRLDWTYSDNNFGVGLPRESSNGNDWAVMRPLLANSNIKPTSAEITWTRDAFRDLLAIRASSTLLRLRTGDDIKQRLSFLNTGSTQVPTVLAAHINGSAYADKVAQTIDAAAHKNKSFVLHPVHVNAAAGDKRAASAVFDAANGRFTVPARTAVVFVVN